MSQCLLKMFPVSRSPEHKFKILCISQSTLFQSFFSSLSKPFLFQFFSGNSAPFCFLYKFSSFLQFCLWLHSLSCPLSTKNILPEWEIGEIAKVDKLIVVYNSEKKTENWLTIDKVIVKVLEHHSYIIVIVHKIV